MEYGEAEQKAQSQPRDKGSDESSAVVCHSSELHSCVVLWHISTPIESQTQSQMVSNALSKPVQIPMGSNWPPPRRPESPLSNYTPQFVSGQSISRTSKGCRTRFLVASLLYLR